MASLQGCAQFGRAEQEVANQRQADNFALLLDSASVRWSNISRVNFIKHLFSRHAPPVQVQPTSHNWPGQSGKEYQFEIYPLDATFRPLPGVYIYARLFPEGYWGAVYISQTRDLHQRLEGHVTIEDAMANGATHLHAHYCSAGQGARCSEEKDLILRWRPVCNDRFPS